MPAWTERDTERPNERRWGESPGSTGRSRLTKVLSSGHVLPSKKRDDFKGEAVGQEPQKSIPRSKNVMEFLLGCV